MNTKLKVCGFKSDFTDKFELIKKVLTVNTTIKAINGQEKRLRPALINILAFYCVYGYSDETKQLVIDSLNINRKNLNQMNSLLTKQGYLVKDERKHHNKLLSEEMNEMIEYFFDDTNKNKIIMLKFDEQ